MARLIENGWFYIYISPGYNPPGWLGEEKKKLLSLSPFLIGRMFVREPSSEYSANLVGS